MFRGQIFNVETRISILVLQIFFKLKYKSIHAEFWFRKKLSFKLNSASKQMLEHNLAIGYLLTKAWKEKKFLYSQTSKTLCLLKLKLNKQCKILKFVNYKIL